MLDKKNMGDHLRIYSKHHDLFGKDKRTERGRDMFFFSMLNDRMLILFYRRLAHSKAHQLTGLVFDDPRPTPPPKKEAPKKEEPKEEDALVEVCGLYGHGTPWHHENTHAHERL